MYDAELIQRISLSRGFANFSDTAISCHIAKLVLMNCGWFAFGLGTAMHAKLLTVPTTRPVTSPQPSSIPHESVA